MIVAKPVVDKKFWILQKDNEKVGNVEATDTGYQVKLNNQITEFKTIKMVEQRANIRFETMPKKAKKLVASNVYGYEVQGRIHNPMWNVQHKLALYTKTNKSKCWLAAGWYQLKQHREWEVVRDPKFILIQRYPYRGPFHTQEEAENETSN